MLFPEFTWTVDSQLSSQARRWSTGAPKLDRKKSHPPSKKNEVERTADLLSQSSALLTVLVRREIMPIVHRMDRPHSVDFWTSAANIWEIVCPNELLCTIIGSGDEHFSSNVTTPNWDNILTHSDYLLTTLLRLQKIDFIQYSRSSMTHKPQPLFCDSRVWYVIVKT